MQHLFRSPTALTAYCGEVERPAPDDPRRSGLPGEDGCPDCIARWEALSGWTIEAARALEATS